jgi:hypothetical protein
MTQGQFRGWGIAVLLAAGAGLLFVRSRSRTHWREQVEEAHLKAALLKKFAGKKKPGRFEEAIDVASRFVSDEGLVTQTLSQYGIPLPANTVTSIVEDARSAGAQAMIEAKPPVKILHRVLQLLAWGVIIIALVALAASWVVPQRILDSLSFDWLPLSSAVFNPSAATPVFGASLLGRFA